MQSRLSGPQEDVAKRFDYLLDAGLHTEIRKVGVSKKETVSRPYRVRTCDTLIKRYKFEDYADKL